MRLALAGGLAIGLSGCVVAPDPYDNGYREVPVYVPWGAPAPYYGGGYYGYQGAPRQQGQQQTPQQPHQHTQPPQQGGQHGGGVVQPPLARSGPPLGGQGGGVRRGQNERPNVGGPDGAASR